MLRNYFTRIVSQVVRKLLYPELVEIRTSLEKIKAQSENINNPGQTSHDQGNLNLQKQLEEITTTITKSIDAIENTVATSQKYNLNLFLDTLNNKISTIDDIAQDRADKQHATILELNNLTENNFERFFKRDSKQNSTLSELQASTAQYFEKINTVTEKLASQVTEEMLSINKRLDDLYKVIVKHEEYSFMVNDVQKLKQDIELLKREAMGKE